MIELGVNIDHVATLRQARRTYEPDPVWAAVEAHLGGADGITVHLREDRRHIQDEDVRRLRDLVHIKLNLELAATDEVVGIACRLRPEMAMLVPEGRHEVTTEGGLDVAGQEARLRTVVARLSEAGIVTSVFIDAEARQVEASARIGAKVCEVHTGPYAHAFHAKGRDAQSAPVVAELGKIRSAGASIRALGMRFNAGHALNYVNVQPVAALPGGRELHIGHAIVARAVFVGLREAVREMKALMRAGAAHGARRTGGRAAMTELARGPLMLGVAGLELSAQERERLAHPPVGGMIPFARNFASPEQLRALTAAIHALRTPALLIAVDHEGGRIQRFRQRFTAIPAMRTLGEAWDRDVGAAARTAAALAWTLASELRAHGVDFSFAPVLDLDYGSSAVIGDRAPHRNPNAVAHLARALVAGLRAGGMAAVGKHFPGHGFVAADSHVAVPVDERPYAAIAAADLVPFAVLARSGLAGVMLPTSSIRRSTRSPPAFRVSGCRTSCGASSASTASCSPTTSRWPARTARATCSRARTRRSPRAARWCSRATTRPPPTCCSHAGGRRRSRSSPVVPPRCAAACRALARSDACTPLSRDRSVGNQP